MLGDRAAHEIGLGGRREAVDGRVAVEAGREGVSSAAAAIACSWPGRRCGYTARQTRARSTDSIARPNAELTCSRLAVRRTSELRL